VETSTKKWLTALGWLVLAALIIAVLIGLFVSYATLD
jgi:hypothetical protein